MFGEGGADRLAGDAGNDRLAGWRGNDILTGGNGRDIFAFNLASFGKTSSSALGSDTITDLEVAGIDHDILQIDAKLGIRDFERLMLDAEQQAGDTVITLNSKTSIKLVGVDKFDLTEDHVLFV